MSPERRKACLLESMRPTTHSWSALHPPLNISAKLTHAVTLHGVRPPILRLLIGFSVRAFSGIGDGPPSKKRQSSCLKAKMHGYLNPYELQHVDIQHLGSWTFPRERHSTFPGSPPFPSKASSPKRRQVWWSRRAGLCQHGLLLGCLPSRISF